jgi:hypothetical protein
VKLSAIVVLMVIVMVNVYFLMVLISIFGVVDRIVEGVVVVELNNSEEIYLDINNFNTDIFEGAVLNMDLSVNFTETRKRVEENLKIIKKLSE